MDASVSPVSPSGSTYNSDDLPTSMNTIKSIHPWTCSETSLPGESKPGALTLRILLAGEVTGKVKLSAPLPTVRPLYLPRTGQQHLEVTFTVYTRGSHQPSRNCACQ